MKFLITDYIKSRSRISRITVLGRVSKLISADSNSFLTKVMMDSKKNMGGSMLSLTSLLNVEVQISGNHKDTRMYVAQSSTKCEVY